MSTAEATGELVLLYIKELNKLNIMNKILNCQTHSDQNSERKISTAVDRRGKGLPQKAGEDQL
jgi:hypothetical protein